ncbi:MAG: hypothetical protein ACTSUE_11190 [Promethearchaeota archaeon]
MEHFLAKIVNGDGADLTKVPSCHYKLVRYSRGKFSGPALSITRRGKSITIKGSLDYEDILGWLVLSAFSDQDEITALGAIIVYGNPAPILEKAFPAEKLVQVAVVDKKKRFRIELQGTWLKRELVKPFEYFHKYRSSWLVKLSLEGTKSISFSAKAKLPQNKGEYSFDKAIKFCSAKLPNTETVLESVVNALLPDASGELKKFKKITLENEYDIEDIVIPEDSKISNKRLAAVRKGTLKRKFVIDGTESEIEYKLEV